MLFLLRSKNYIVATYGGGKGNPENNNQLALWDVRQEGPNNLIIHNADVRQRYVSFNNKGQK